MFDTVQLEKRFVALMVAQGRDPGIARRVFENLDWHYKDRCRRYHTWAHIAHCLDQFDAAAASTPADPVIVEIAIWFHDAEYFVHAPPGKNEVLSAMLASNSLTYLGFDSPFCKEVEQVIHATVHDGVVSSDEEAFMTDVDLSALGGSYEDVRKDGRQIRAEYAHLRDVEFYAGRAAFLKQLLQREHLYHLPWFRERFEARARENILRSITEAEAMVRDTTA
jgi:predicted metal-dependent HD superfamily phosphohydrolase